MPSSPFKKIALGLLPVETEPGHRELGSVRPTKAKAGEANSYLK